MKGRISRLAPRAFKHVWRASASQAPPVLKSQGRYIAIQAVSDDHTSQDSSKHERPEYADPHSIPPPQSDIPRSVQFLMRASAHPVYAVVAFADINPNYSEEAIIEKFRYKPCFSGLLVSSLNTVTIRPEPYISFNVKTNGETYRRIREWGRFTATQLTDVSTAYAFAGVPNTMIPKRDLLWRPGEGVTRDQGAAATMALLPPSDNPRKWLRQWVEKKGQVPRKGGGGAWMRCEYVPEKSTEVGDHCIVVGRVVEVGLKGNDAKNDMFYIHGRYSWFDRRKLMERPAYEEYRGLQKQLDLSDTQRE